jgi:hypothetical protein
MRSAIRIHKTIRQKWCGRPIKRNLIINRIVSSLNHLISLNLRLLHNLLYLILLLLIKKILKIFFFRIF